MHEFLPYPLRTALPRAVRVHMNGPASIKKYPLKALLCYFTYTASNLHSAAIIFPTNLTDRGFFSPTRLLWASEYQG
jgi:hypothetical protein